MPSLKKVFPGDQRRMGHLPIGRQPDADRPTQRSGVGGLRVLWKNAKQAVIFQWTRI